MLRSICGSLLTITSIAVLSAAEPASNKPRLIGELLVGTAGFEPGVAAEWDFDWNSTMVRVRPELLLNGFLPGIAASATVPVAKGSLPANQELWVGPRLVFHNDRYNGGEHDDDLRYGFGAEAVAFYVFPIAPDHPGHQTIEAIGAIGVVDHNDDLDASVTIGAAYGYQF